MHKISLCVPTYNRSETLRQLINSFLKQDYKNKELVLSDDSPTSVIADVVKEYNNSSIKYYHNKVGLGFNRNLLKAMEQATGDYLIILGDDDILFHMQVLSDYVNIFKTKPHVGFIYSNQVQFSDNLDIQYIINFFSSNKEFKKGKDAMKNMWIRSIFIGGIGIRNDKNIKKMYPIKKILHPQVEFIGHIINKYDAYLLAKNYIGFRSHEDQIIFRALKNKKIRQEGNHMTQELFDIFQTLQRKYTLAMNFDFAAEQLIDQMMIMLFKEKSYVGKKEMEKNYKKFCQLSQKARKSKKLKFAFSLAKILPGTFVTYARDYSIKLIALRNRSEFAKYKAQLNKMIAR